MLEDGYAMDVFGRIDRLEFGVFDFYFVMVDLVVFSFMSNGL